MTCPSRAITSRGLTWSPSFATTLLIVTRPVSIRRSASRLEQMPCRVKNLLMRMVSVTTRLEYLVKLLHMHRCCRILKKVVSKAAARRPFSVSCLVDPATGSYTSEDAVNQTRNTKLRGNKSFDRSNLADIHAKDAGPVGKRRDEVQRVIPSETAGLRGP